METLVKSFAELTKELQVLAGGKGGTLARMFQQGYPVPDGFVIFPSAFVGEKLLPAASDLVHTCLQALRKKHKGAAFAVRSSALGEDSKQASYAGAFETVLGAKTDEEIWSALFTVERSTQSERVQTYSSVQGLDQPVLMAVVVQLMVPSEMSGILFTADPVTGNYTAMVGNALSGLGEQLVSGEANPTSFQLKRPKGSYEGPDALLPYASRLYQLARRLERELDCPQDIEWAVAKGKLYLLQTRPITTLKAGDLETYDLNYTLIEDALWTNTNVAEAMPDVLSPLTWSIGRQLDEELNFIPGYYIWSGNIAGRAYMNISRRVSVISSLLGRHADGALKLISDLYGPLPEGMRMPLHLFSRGEVIRAMFPRLVRLTQKMLIASVHLSRFLKQTPARCREMRERIQNIKRKEELLLLWKQELEPTLLSAWLTGAAGASKLVAVMTLDTRLTKLVGMQESNTMLSNLRGGTELASLGPVVGISKVIKGEMSREEYLSRYGHRGPHEYELSIPDLLEDTNWLEQQIEEAKKSPLDVEGLLNKQHVHYEEAVMRFHQRYPQKRKWLEKQLAKASQAAQLREELRSEFVRVFRVMRAFARRAGELTDLGNDIFFLYIEEVEELLAGGEGAVKHIPARKANYEKYKALPPLPSLIRGRFDPFEWAKNPNRRHDFYDATLPLLDLATAQTLTGSAGAAGRVEGRVRVLASPEEGEQLEPGEILVAATTNVGWTPLFPKAAAIITDIGAPLSHAAIVARELGIPAVVGCGNATTRLKTGERVIVDGGQGTVFLVEK